ncbi:MAG: hypothetical protein ACI4QY_04120 [Oscillospiraceae bacterium]
MPKKVTIASAISLVLLIALIAILVKIAPKPPQSIIPAQVSVLFPEENTILLLSCDEFLTGCVRGLLPRGENPNPEAIRAICAAQRTRILYHLQTSEQSSENLGADFTVGEEFPYTRSGDEALNVKIRAAVQSSELLTIERELFDAELCRISSGRTDESTYSPSVPLICDTDVGNSRLAFTYEEVWQTLKPSRAPADCSKWFQNPVYESTGTLRSIEFCDTEISGEELQNRFKLPSAAITVEFSEDTFYFSCKGQGNNRGMSVNGAIFLAKSGYSAEDILKLFYPEAEIIISEI